MLLGMTLENYKPGDVIQITKTKKYRIQEILTNNSCIVDFIIEDKHGNQE
jgi:hypothetical protein